MPLQSTLQCILRSNYLREKHAIILTTNFKQTNIDLHLYFICLNSLCYPSISISCLLNCEKYRDKAKNYVRPQVQSLSLTSYSSGVQVLWLYLPFSCHGAKKCTVRVHHSIFKKYTLK